jgi:hypothetical protein
MEDYVTLNELYIYDSNLFKKNLKSFIKINKIEDKHTIKLKGNKIGISTTWIKKNLPSFNLKLTENADVKYTEALTLLEKYGCKVLNPIILNLDSTMVKYFNKNGKRTPYFTQKGVIKIKMFFNDIPEPIFNWIHELTNGSLNQYVDNLENMVEIIALEKIPILSEVDDKMVLNKHLYNLNDKDIIVDFKQIGHLKKELQKEKVIKNIESYKCPVFAQLQLNYKRGLEEAQKNFETKLQEIKQEKMVELLKHELEKEKCLKDQAISLTQSFIPHTFSHAYKSNIPTTLLTPVPQSLDSGTRLNQTTTSPLVENNQREKSFKSLNLLKPSKIQ